MIEFEIPDISLVPVTLTPVPDQPLMTDAVPPSPLPKPIDEQLSVGQPVAIHLTPQWAGRDEELAQFIRAESATHRYWLVHLACTLSPAADSTIETANLTCYLAREDGNTDQLPIAMSMTPSRIRDIERLRVSRTVKVSADLRVVEPALEYGQETDHDKTTNVVVAHNLQEPDPFWSLRGTDGVALEGSFRFAVVVRAEHDSGANLQIALNGQARERRFGFFRFRVYLPPALRQPVKLP